MPRREQGFKANLRQLREDMFQVGCRSVNLTPLSRPIFN